MFIKAVKLDATGHTESSTLAYVDKSAWKSRELRRLSYERDEKHLDSRQSILVVGFTSLITGVVALFVMTVMGCVTLADGKGHFWYTAYPFAILCLCAITFMIADWMSNRTKRSNKAIEASNDRNKAITFTTEEYGNSLKHRAGNSFAMSALLDTQFGKEQLTPLMFDDGYIQSAKDLKKNPNGKGNEVFANTLQPILDEFLGGTTKEADIKLIELGSEGSPEEVEKLEKALTRRAEIYAERMQYALETYRENLGSAKSVKQWKANNDLSLMTDQLALEDGYSSSLQLD